MKKAKYLRTPEKRPSKAKETLVIKKNMNVVVGEIKAHM